MTYLFVLHLSCEADEIDTVIDHLRTSIEDPDRIICNDGFTSTVVTGEELAREMFLSGISFMELEQMGIVCPFIVSTHPVGTSDEIINALYEAAWDQAEHDGLVQ